MQRDDAQVTAYAVDTFEQRWSRPLSRTDSSVGNCGGLLCEQDATGWRLLDPATGAEQVHGDQP